MRVFKCNSCTKIHVEAGNILIDFVNEEQLIKYLRELDGIDVEYYAALNAGKPLSKSIFLPVSGVNVKLGFTVDEFEVFKNVIRSYLSASYKTINLICDKNSICLN